MGMMLGCAIVVGRGGGQRFIPAEGYAVYLHSNQSQPHR